MIRRVVLGLGAAAVLAVGVFAVTEPYAFHIGGGFTPLGRWTGVAEGTGPGATRYAVELNLQAPVPGRECSSNGCAKFVGTAVVCTRKVRLTYAGLHADGSGWLSLDGHPMTVVLSSPSPHQVTAADVELHGAWQGPAYVASDVGSLTSDYDSSGEPRTQVPGFDPKAAVHLTFRPGDFDTLCRAVQAG